MSGLLEPLRLGEEAPAGHSRTPKTAEPFATTAVHVGCVKAASELHLPVQKRENRDTSVNYTMYGRADFDLLRQRVLHAA